MDFITILMALVSDFQPGRLVESLIFLVVLWKKVLPHLTKIEKRLEGLEDAVKQGFNSGELRFITIEDRISKLETSKGSLIT